MSEVTELFDKQIDLPLIRTGHWDLMRKVAEMYAPYAEGKLTYRAQDTRGRYEASELEALRRRADQRDAELEMLTLESTGIVEEGGVHRYFIVMMNTKEAGGGGLARVISGDEAIVVYAIARLNSLFGAAAARSEESALEDYLVEEAENPPHYVNVVTGYERAPPKPGPVRRSVNYAYEHFVKAIIIGVIVAVVAALIISYGFGIG